MIQLCIEKVILQTTVFLTNANSVDFHCRGVCCGAAVGSLRGMLHLTLKGSG